MDPYPMIKIVFFLPDPIQSVRFHSCTMNIEILESTKQLLKVNLGGIDSSIANGLRRAILDDVATMAIDIVRIHENTTVMNDDLLAHRLCAIPLAGAPSVQSTDADMFCFPSECNCEDGCEKCGIEFALDVSNRSNQDRLVTSGDLKPLAKKALYAPVRNDTAIALLGKNQQLSLTVRAVKGTGKQHMKWMPTPMGGAAARPVACITLDHVRLALLTPEERRSIAQACAARVFECDPTQNDQLMIAPQGIERCPLCMDCVEQAAEVLDKRLRKSEQATRNVQEIEESLKMKSGAFIEQDLIQAKLHAQQAAQDAVVTQGGPLIRIEPSERDFIFVVETLGSLSPTVVLRKAVRALQDRITAFQKGLAESMAKI
jgi:hypothetical protein